MRSRPAVVLTLTRSTTDQPRALVTTPDSPARPMSARVLRVLLLTKGLGPGGAERLLVEQVAARSADVEYEVAFLLSWKQHLVPELEDVGAPTHCLSVRNEADPRWVLRLERLIRAGDFDLVHAHAPLSAAAARVQVR